MSIGTLSRCSNYSKTSMPRTPMARFTMTDSNSFLSPYEIIPIAQEIKYLGKFSYFIMKLYVVCTHRCDSNEYIQHTIVV